MKIKFRALAPVTALALATLTFALSAAADINVLTLGGGPKGTVSSPPYGNVGGNTFTQAQFNTPISTALDSSGNLFLADQVNRQICKITAVGNTATSTNIHYITNLSQVPVSVLVDSSDNLYFLCLDNIVRKFDKAKHPLATNYLGSVSGPTAMTFNPNGTSLYVCYSSGTILEVYQNGTSPRTVMTGLGNMRGIGVLPTGEIVVSVESGSTYANAILVCSTNSSSVRVLAGNNGGGFQNGDGVDAQFNAPQGLAVSMDGKVVVADRDNHCVRKIDFDGTTSTLYGIAASDWGGGYFPGWKDGSDSTAASRLPVSVTISTNGVVYTTEVYWHILRQVTGTGLTNGVAGTSGNTNGTGIVVPPPAFSPNSGYFPQCTTITVTTGGGSVYYTTDGSIPTTNSTYVPTPNNVGTFTWCNSTNVLGNLKMKAFIGTNASVTVSGVGSPVNEVGFTKDVIAGIGATVVVPIVLNLQSNGVLKSLQFRVEVTPANGTPDKVPTLEMLTITDNDFVPVVGPGQGPVTFQTFSYAAANNGQGLVITALGNSGFDTKNFAVVAMLKIQIPATCSENQTYQLSVQLPTGTSDGGQTSVPINSMPPRTITIQNVQYLVGDSSPGRWYNAGEFGDATLENTDVNNALYASLGIRVPYSFSDAFDAMDAFPETPNGLNLKGDGKITFLDWQHIWRRSLGIESINWVRSWSAGGVRTHQTTNLILTPHIRTSPSIATPGNVWVREAAISSGTANTLLPGAAYSLPVYVKVGAGFSLAGLQFRATLVPEGGAPTPSTISFTSAAGITGGQVLPGPTPNDIICAWSIGALANSLTGSTLLGYINFTVPANASGGSHYTLNFLHVDGAPDMDTFYELESMPGSAWVMATSTNTPSITSDEWKTYFFGSTTNSLAADNADPDHDGVPNWKEYLAGTDPNNAGSCLQFNSVVSATGATTLTWLSAPGKTYVIEAAASPASTTWTNLGTVVGDGTVQQVTEPNSGAAQFYRIRLQP
jgi:hypothetical protein